MKTVFWQKHPALRILLPFSAGIYLQWHFTFSSFLIMSLLATFLFPTLLYQQLRIKRKFLLIRVNGLILQLLIFTAGLLISWKNDCRNQEKTEDFFQPGSAVVAILDEPLAEKQNSYKTTATIRFPGQENKIAGKVIIYLNKDTNLLSALSAGSPIIFRKLLTEIRNSGNPGSFDYKRYCLFQGITHQVYLKSGEFRSLPGKITTFPEESIFSIRAGIINIIRKYIPGKKQQGLAEALLIGYRDDLDRSLVQAYANTGVVHVIAISGLHLGIIYGLLVFLTTPLNRKGGYWFRFLLIVGGLWTFTLIAGAQPSVLRSAVMFSFVAAGVVLKKNTPVINSLALSALLLLCWKPQWLWDVGFQLSYTAVLSIVLFFKHVYGWLYLENKIIDAVWKLTAVTISAQFLTLPISLYYFNQFPLLLLITNLVAVPLSTVILISEILLVATSWLYPVAFVLGEIAGKLILWMNLFIEGADQLTFNTWRGLQVSELQVVSLYIIITSASVWLLKKEKQYAFVAATALLLFISCRTLSFLEANGQKKLVVYNIGKTSATDLILGRKNIFLGNDSLLKADNILDFHLTPSWRQHRVKRQLTSYDENLSFNIKEKSICLMSRNGLPPRAADLMIVSGNLKPFREDVLLSMQLSMAVLDASVSYRSTKEWKKILMKLKIPFHDVKEQGAFVMNL